MAAGGESLELTTGYSCLLDETVEIFGNVELGDRVLVERGVTLGHPSHIELAAVNAERSRSSIQRLYQDAVRRKTVIGHDSTLRSWTTVYSGVTIGTNADVGHHVVIREDVTLGDFTYLFPATQIKPHAVIGKGSRVAGTICDRAVVGPYANCLGHLVHQFRVGVGGKVEEAPCIETGAIVGREAVVIGGVTVGEFALVASNTTVTTDVEPFSIVVGTPMRVVGERSESGIDEMREKIAQGGRL